MPIYTVLGPVPPEDILLTSMHEHVLIDGTAMTDDRQLWAETGAAVSLENIGVLRWNTHGLRENLRVDDEQLVIRELQRFRAAGGSAVVDMTNVGLGRQVGRLGPISQQSGVHILVGCGWYVAPTHPALVRDSAPEELAAVLTSELICGLDGTGVLPALIGEIGTSTPITADERKVLFASGQAAATTGAAVNVHVDPRGQEGRQVVEILLGTGMASDRIILSHMDENLCLNYHLDLASTGAILEFDTFGQESYWDYPYRDPTDEQRFTHLAQLLDHGLENQLVLGCDVYTKACHREYGGMGYEHLPARVAPTLHRRFGATPEQLDKMLVNTPRRLLARNDVTTLHTNPSAPGASAVASLTAQTPPVFGTPH